MAQPFPPRTPRRDEVRAVLDSINPDLTREDWVRVAMALKATLGDDGFAIFDAWSRGGVTFDSRAARATWTSVQTDGGITYGTLRYIAERHGYRVTASPQAHAHDALTAESRGIVDERATPDDDGRRSTRDSLGSETSAEEPKNDLVPEKRTPCEVFQCKQGERK